MWGGMESAITPLAVVVVLVVVVSVVPMVVVELVLGLHRHTTSPTPPQWEATHTRIIILPPHPPSQCHFPHHLWALGREISR